jgi:glutamate racemase
MNDFKKNQGGPKKTILVTDSGLGGLSIFAGISNRLAEKSPWPAVSMVYFNAWPEQYKGYNHLKTMDQKAGVFNNALMAMENFKPDIILVACNTLSVIYPFTPYSRDTATRVSGIVDHGVQLIHEHLIKDPDSQVILFGTPTTIAEKSHERQLIKMGIDPLRITPQACTDLAGKIERNPFGKDVPQLINANVCKAVSKMQNPTRKVYAALCCTHFGYCKDLFKTALSKLLKQAVVILDPNQRMADQVVKIQDPKTSVSSDIDMHIVSRVFWDPQRIEAYGRLLKNISPLTVKALESYEWKPDLFEV